MLENKTIFPSEEDIRRTDKYEKLVVGCFQEIDYIYMPNKNKLYLLLYNLCDTDDVVSFLKISLRDKYNITGWKNIMEILLDHNDRSFGYLFYGLYTKDNRLTKEEKRFIAENKARWFEFLTGKDLIDTKKINEIISDVVSIIKQLHIVSYEINRQNNLILNSIHSKHYIEILIHRTDELIKDPKYFQAIYDWAVDYNIEVVLYNCKVWFIYNNEDDLMMIKLRWGL